MYRKIMSVTSLVNVLAQLTTAFQLYHSPILCFYYYLFLDRGEGREKEGEKHQCGLPFVRPQLGAWPATQACALTGNRTYNPLVCRPVLNPLSHTSQGYSAILINIKTYSNQKKKK